MLTIEEIVREVRTLPVEERKRLIGLIVDTLTDQEPSSLPKRSIWNSKGWGQKSAGHRRADVCEPIAQRMDDRP